MDRPPGPPYHRGLRMDRPPEPSQDRPPGQPYRRGLMMARLPEPLQEPIHEGRDQGEEDPRVAWLKTLEEFALRGAWHTNFARRRANIDGVEKGVARLKEQLELTREDNAKDPHMAWLETLEDFPLRGAWHSSTARHRANLDAVEQGAARMKEQLKRARDKDSAQKYRAETAEREVARLLAKVAELEGGVGVAVGGPDRFSKCSVPATPGLAHRFSLQSPTPNLTNPDGSRQ